jgi:hypothetical protein
LVGLVGHRTIAGPEKGGQDCNPKKALKRGHGRDMAGESDLPRALGIAGLSARELLTPSRNLNLQGLE